MRMEFLPNNNMRIIVTKKSDNRNIKLFTGVTIVQFRNER